MITVDCCRQRCRPYHTRSYGWWVGILIMMVVLHWKPTSPLVLRSRSVSFVSSFQRSSPTITAVLSVPTWKMGQPNHILQDKVQFSRTATSTARSRSMVLPAVVPLKYNYDYFEEQEKGFGAKDYIPPYEDERDQDDDDGGSNRETCFVYMTTTMMTSAPERSKNPTVTVSSNPKKPLETRTTINTKDDFQNQKQSRTQFTNRASFKPSSIPPSS